MITAKQASEICNRIFDADSTVYYLAFIDPMGELIFESLRRSVPEEVSRLTPTNQERLSYGAQAAILSNMFKMPERLLGELHYVHLAYQTNSLLVVSPSSRAGTLVLLISKSADERSIVRRVLELLDSF